MSTPNMPCADDQLFAFFPVVHQSFIGWGAYSNEVLKWLNVASTSESVAQWKADASAAGLGLAVPYTIPLSNVITGLLGDGQNTSSPAIITEGYMAQARTETHDLACVVVFAAGKGGIPKPERISGLSSALRNAIYSGLSVRMESAPLTLGVGDGWRVNGLGMPTLDCINLALSLARESNTLSLLCLSRVLREYASSISDDESEVSFECRKHYERWFTKVSLAAKHTGDDPICADFYFFPDDNSTHENTVDDCLAYIMQFLSEGKTAPASSASQNNFIHT